MERDNDSTSQDSVTPTQTVPNASNASNVSGGVEEEDENAYR